MFEFGKDLQNFLMNAEALAGSLTLSKQSIVAEREKMFKDFTKFINENFRPVVGKKRSFIIPVDVSGNFEIKLSNLSKIIKSEQITSRIFLVGLVSQFDAYIKSIINDMCTVKPDIIRSFEKSINIDIIFENPNLDAVKEKIIDNEIDKTLRDSHVEQINWIKQKSGLSMDMDGSILSDFIEITERRNLYVHADGIVNDVYIKNCKKWGYIFEEDTIVGSALHVDDKYILDAIGCLSYVAIWLKQIVRRKLLPEETTKANSELIEIMVDIIKTKHYEHALHIADLALSKEFLSGLKNLDKLICNINKAQILKWMGKKDLMNNLLDNNDWSGAGEEFNLCIAVLKDKYKEASDIMVKVGKHSNLLSMEGYLTWPIFKNFRKSKHFKTAYNSIYGTKYRDVSEETSFITKLIDGLT